MHSHMDTHHSGSGPSRPGLGTDVDNHKPPPPPPCERVGLLIHHCLTLCAPTSPWAPSNRGCGFHPLFSIPLIPQWCAWEQIQQQRPPPHPWHIEGLQGPPRWPRLDAVMPVLREPVLQTPDYRLALSLSSSSR